MKAQDVALTEAGALMVAALPRLRRYARALVGDRAAADDLVQDTLERAWARIDSWRPDGDMRAWLFSILHNLHVDQRRRPAVVAVPLDEEALASPVRASQTDGLEMRDLEIALRQLPPEQREVLLLVALEDMSYDEIARTLGVPLGTVMSRLSRGRARLRGVMEGRIQPTALKVVK
ncbi:RNA polymerase sigma factor [Tepidimonas sp. HKU77]|uniref:RNA polymerase sigma factor n=1 Tax=Tepidimonas sp. HKU77 TaxID=3414503 RepID=UPI003C7ED1D8